MHKVHLVVTTEIVSYKLSSKAKIMQYKNAKGINKHWKKKQLKTSKYR